MTSSTITKPDNIEDDGATRTRIARELDTCIALDAGAGSGKTSVLTQRLVALLERGTSARSIAAITFTEKAAGELVARVRELLEERLASPDASPEAKARLADVLDRFGEITISTIHSFCRDLLSIESLEADFAPDTEIGDETFAEQLLLDALRIWRDGLRTRRPELWTLLEQLVTSFALKNAAAGLYRYRHYRDVTCNDAFDPSTARTELQELLAAVHDAAKACKKIDDKLITKNEALVEFLTDIADAQKTPDALVGILEALLRTDTPKTKGAGTAKNWPVAGSKDRYAEAIVALETWKQRWREHAHGELVRDMHVELMPLLDKNRRESSIATFDDLLTSAAKLLRENVVARERLAGRFLVILVDEVQDTDPVQAEVASLLARPLSSSGTWDESSPEAGRLFAVGDPKQSIYRFRGADVDTFKRVKTVITRNGENAALSRNFRSVPSIVQWVNTTFAGFDGYQPQTAHSEPAMLDPIVVVDTFKAAPANDVEAVADGDTLPPVETPSGGAGVPARHVDPRPTQPSSPPGTSPGATSECDEIEGALRHLHSLFASGAKVFDKPSNTLRPIEARDVMVLLPAWAKADLIADRFRAAGYECVVEGGDTFFERDEVRLGMAALRAFVEPADTEATVFLLRGVFGLSLEELAKHAAAKGSFRFTLPNPPPGPVADALQSLGKIHRGRGSRSLSALLDEFFDVTRVTAVWAALPDGKSRLANLDKLKAMLRKVEGTTTSPLAAVEELQRIERNVANKDIDRIDDDGNAIRVTSLFKAKGLEAPVVMLLFARRKTDGVQLIVDHAKATVAIRMSVLAPPDWEALQKIERAHEEEERRRWMYVAATRARDQLVIVRTIEMTVPKTEDDEPQRKFPTTCLLRRDVDNGLPDPSVDDLDHEDLIDCHGVDVRWRRADDLAPAPRSTSTFGAVDALVTKHLATPVASMPLSTDASSAFASMRKQKLREAKRGCVRWRAASGEPTTKVWRPGIAVDSANAEEASEVVAVSVGARGGRVVHAVMERLDLARPHDELVARGTDLAAILGKQAGLPDELIQACQHIVERILVNPLVDLARKAPERWAEVPFTYPPRAGTIISGTIDLCFPLDESRREWAVFDWKSKVPPIGDPLRERYAQQLERYATALLKTLGDVKVTRLEIVGPYPELGVQAEPEDVLGDVRGDLLEPLVRFLARGATAPDVYDDVADGDTVIAAPDLSWPTHKLAIIVDATPEVVAALNALGWTVHGALDETVAQLLGLAPAPPPEDA